MPIRRSLAAAAVTALTLTGLGATAGTAAAAAASPSAPTSSPSTPSSAPARSPTGPRRLGGRIEHVYTAALHGFAVRLPERRWPHGWHPARRRRRGAGPGDAPGDHAENPRHLGSGPDRPARRCRSTAATATPRPGPGVTAYVIDTGIALAPQRLRRPGVERLRRSRRRQRRRLQRPRHPRRRHDRRDAPTAWPRASRSSPSGCSTAPAAAARPASSPGSTG